MKNKRLGRCKNQTNLLKKYEQLLKPIIFERDGYKCAIAGYRHKCSDKLVMDHRPAKRGKHSTFLDPRNLTTVCSDANMLAELDPFISLRIIEQVIKREGDVIEELEFESRKTKKWSKEECFCWVKACEEYFKTRKYGRPQ